VPREQGATVSLANAISHLSQCSAGVSVEPAEYNWGAPSPMQQQQLYSQYLSLAFMCSVAPMPNYAMSMAMQPQRPPLYPGCFMSPFSSWMPPTSSPSPSPSPSPCPPASQQTSGSDRPEAATAGALSKKAAAQGKKAGTKPKSAKAGAMPAGAGSAAADDLECAMDDIATLLGDDAFLEQLQDDVLSEGSNGSSASPDCRALPKTASHGSLCANDSGAYPRNSFATAFDLDLDMDDVPAAAAAPDGSGWAHGTAPSSAMKANSGDLNNMLPSPSPTKSTRSSRLAAREVAAAAAKDSGPGAGAGAGAAPAPLKITLKVKGGGVQKSAAVKASKGQQQHVAAAMVAPAAQGASAAEDQLTAADLSRLLGEDDNRIPDGWDLDLDFENPFSCSIGAF
ncbi:hypothetical protein TSOC_004010, partial [Tetrabaena socialis]